jgi:hypothetical protein
MSEQPEDRTCIKMSNGNIYLIDLPISQVINMLNSIDSLIKIPGSEGRTDFFINPLQVSAVYQAHY